MPSSGVPAAAAPDAPAIRVAALTFLYPQVRALDDVGFTIARGTVTALVGPNGAGKTTLLRCIAGLDRPLQGHIAVDGIDVLADPRRAHARIGYLSDFFGLYDALTVRQCLAHAASARGLAAEQVAGTVSRTAGRLGLTDRLDHRCGGLSRGLRQRVAIGQAIVHAPAVLLLDEPAAGLDPEARHALAALFTDLRREGMTLLVSSHILAELDEYSTHMLVLRGGRVVEHRALAATHAGTPVRVALVRSHPRWPSLVEELPAVRAVETDPEGGLLAIDGGGAGRAAVLRALVEAGIDVASFAPAAENLQRSYLRTLRSEDSVT